MCILKLQIMKINIYINYNTCISLGVRLILLTSKHSLPTLKAFPNPTTLLLWKNANNYI